MSGGGCRSHFHSYWKDGIPVQSTLGKVRSQLSWENRGNLYGGEQAVLHIHFCMNNKRGEQGKRSLEVVIVQNATTVHFLP